MRAASRPTESSIAALTRPNYRSGASNDGDVMKKEIIAAVRDEIRKETQQNIFTTKSTGDGIH